MTATFDFRIGGSPAPVGADGMAFALLDTDEYGSRGPAPRFGEEPNLTRSLGVGFDTWNNGEVNDNHLSIHFDGQKLAEVPLELNANPEQNLVLRSHEFQRARISVTQLNENGSNVSVWITPDLHGSSRTEIPVITDFFVEGLTAYTSRVAFGARTGGFTDFHDIDNVHVQWTMQDLSVDTIAPKLILPDDIVTAIEFDGSYTRKNRLRRNCP